MEVSLSAKVGINISSKVEAGHELRNRMLCWDQGSPTAVRFLRIALTAISKEALQIRFSIM